MNAHGAAHPPALAPRHAGRVVPVSMAHATQVALANERSRVRARQKTAALVSLSRIAVQQEYTTHRAAKCINPVTALINVTPYSAAPARALLALLCTPTRPLGYRTTDRFFGRREDEILGQHMHGGATLGLQRAGLVAEDHLGHVEGQLAAELV
jgi:hypothetical protein